MSRPLGNIKVFLPREENSTLAQQLGTFGFRVVAHPLTQTVACDGLEQNPAWYELSTGRYSWLVFTSPRTIRVLGEVGVPLQIPATTRVAAVGPATAATLKNRGVRVDFIPGTVASATGLVEDWPERAGMGGSRVLIPGSAQSAPTLAQGLHGLGYEVTTVAVYQTLPCYEVPVNLVEQWRRGEFSVAVVTAGSNARALVELFGPLPDHTRAVTIGEPSARACAELGIRVGAVALEPSADGIRQAIMEVLEKEQR